MRAPIGDVYRFIRFAPRRLVRIAKRFSPNHIHTGSPSNDPFDVQHGTDTQEIVRVYKLDSVNGSYIHSNGYEASPTSAFAELVEWMPANRDEYTFIDIGCGKGRTLMLAAQAGFGRVIGVEVSPALVKIAAKNLEITHTKGSVIGGDAGLYEIPDEPCVLYFYNPFGKAVMERVVAKVSERRARNSGPLWVIYYSPAYKECFDALPGIQVKALDPRYVIYRVC